MSGTFSLAVRIGLTLKVQASCFSVIATIGLFGYLAVSYTLRFGAHFKCTAKRQMLRTGISRRSFSRLSPFHIFLVSILCGELFEATSKVIRPCLAPAFIFSFLRHGHGHTVDQTWSMNHL